MLRKSSGRSMLLPGILAACLGCAALAQTQRSPAAAPAVAFSSRNGMWTLLAADRSQPVFRARSGARVGGRWLDATQYPRHQVRQRPFRNALGEGTQWVLTNTGLAAEPDLVCSWRAYSNRPWGEMQIALVNHTSQAMEVSDLRVAEARDIQLGGAEAEDRVLSDSFSEDRPALRIYDLGQAPGGMHRASGSQLLFNRASGQSLLVAALTSDRWLTLMHLATRPRPGGTAIASWTVDSTGTTEILKEQSLRNDPPQDQMTLRLPLAPGATLDSERVLFATAGTPVAMLRNYGAAIRRLHHPRVHAAPMMGWWSWTAYYFGISQGTGLTNAAWLSQHLLPLGFKYFHIDEGYQYARGEYGTPDAPQFPEGFLPFGHAVTRDGLRLGIWTAPFEVSERAWVYQHHRDWLVHNAAGQPIPLGYVGRRKDRLYCLDATNPGAQAYLRATYSKLVRQWNVTYIKLDFMDDTAIEGVYYRPHTTALEAQRIGLRVIRDAVGPDVRLDKDGSPMLNPVGLVDEGRVSQDTGHTFSASHDAAPGIAARFYMDGNYFTSDPDAFSVSKQTILDQGWHNSRTPLSLNEAQVSIVLAAVAGGMYEIGDDLPTLGREANRLALVENSDLLNMVRLQKPAIPLDLMDYSAADEQPSLFLLREGRRQAMLAVFNWSEGARSHDLTLARLGLPTGTWQATDVLDGNQSVSLTGGHLVLANQPAHSVRLLKLVDQDVADAPPVIEAAVPATVAVGKELLLSAAAQADGTPAVNWRWDFGDGISATGARLRHTWTEPGSYPVTITATGVDGRTASVKKLVEVSGHIDTDFNPQSNRRFLRRPATGIHGPD